jgi:hypothetical protein
VLPQIAVVAETVAKLELMWLVWCIRLMSNSASYYSLVLSFGLDGEADVGVDLSAVAADGDGDDVDDDDVGVDVVVDVDVDVDEGVNYNLKIKIFIT